MGNKEVILKFLQEHEGESFTIDQITHHLHLLSVLPAPVEYHLWKIIRRELEELAEEKKVKSDVVNAKWTMNK